MYLADACPPLANKPTRSFLVDRTVIVWCTFLGLFFLFLPVSWAQGPLSELPWRLGPGPGAEVSVPEVETVQGGMTEANTVSLIFFTVLDGSEGAYEVVALATAWQERHPGVQVILVDTRSDAEEVRVWVQQEDVQVAVVADANDAFEEAFDTNRLPILYLLDEQGMIQDKVVGNSLERFIELDQVLTWAETGDWERVTAQRSEWLTVGQVPARMLADVPLGQGSPTIVYHTSPFCDLCQTIAEGDLQTELNALAERYPNAAIVILESDANANRDLEELRSYVKTYIELYGREAAPGPLLLAIERGRLPDARSLPLPQEEWAPNIRFVTYTPRDVNDPQRWWGQPLVPGLMLFDAQGAYQGPTPLWEGPYSASALTDFLAEFLQNQ